MRNARIPRCTSKYTYTNPKLFPVKLNIYIYTPEIQHGTACYSWGLLKWTYGTVSSGFCSPGNHANWVCIVGTANEQNKLITYLLKGIPSWAWLGYTIYTCTCKLSNTCDTPLSGRCWNPACPHEVRKVCLNWQRCSRRTLIHRHRLLWGSFNGFDEPKNMFGTSIVIIIIIIIINITIITRITFMMQWNRGWHYVETATMVTCFWPGVWQSFNSHVACFFCRNVLTNENGHVMFMKTKNKF